MNYEIELDMEMVLFFDVYFFSCFSTFTSSKISVNLSNVYVKKEKKRGIIIIGGSL